MAYPVLGAELINGNEVDSIIESAKKYEADLLILGMRKHRLLMGHTATDIVEQLP